MVQIPTGTMLRAISEENMESHSTLHISAIGLLSCASWPSSLPMIESFHPAAYNQDQPIKFGLTSLDP